MQHLSIIEQSTREAVKAFIKERNLSKYQSEDYRHPQEDYLLASKSSSVFVVADGVTLNFRKLMDDGVKYPNPSPAGKVAKIFCKAVVESVREKRDKFNKKTLIEIFKEANGEVKKYNKKVGKSDVSGNQTGFYSATGAFAIIEDKRSYWASICDSFVAHFDKKMNKKFMSSGCCSPYAVINGEEKMAKHLEAGVFNLASGDRIFIFTDGFEHYLKNPEFLKIFKHWDDGILKRIAKFSKKMNLKNPENYGHERSLIAILAD